MLQAVLALAARSPRWQVLSALFGLKPIVDSLIIMGGKGDVKAEGASGVGAIKSNASIKSEAARSCAALGSPAAGKA